MKDKIRIYGRSAFIGASIVFITMVIMSALDMIIIPYEREGEVIAVFLLWTGIIGLVAHHFDYLKKKVPLLLKFGGLLLLLIFINIYDESADIRDNPLTVSLAIVFFSGLVYTVLPRFFKKYALKVLPLYGVLMLYFFMVRYQDNYNHEEHEAITTLLGISIPILFTLWVYEQWRWVKTLKNEKSKAELQLLKSQVNPHFFFNTLNNLYGLTVEKSDKAPEVVLKLGDMMRYTIYQGKEEEVNIQDEILYLENYIELHRIRYQKNVQIHFINSVISDYKIAPLLFIILLENAFKHGVETLVENAYIFIEIEENDKEISFAIENNFDRVFKTPSRGIGLENLKKRLELIYPNKHQISTEIGIDTYKVLLTIDLS